MLHSALLGYVPFFRQNSHTCIFIKR